MTRQPECRTDDFMKAMADKLDTIIALQTEHDNCPVLHSGDVFDEWFLHKGEQWLMTLLIRAVKNWICVPGQHDLPQHNLELYRKSNLAVLEEAGRVEVLLDSNMPKAVGIAAITGFPWGTAPEPSSLKGPSIALIHRMAYPGKPPYPGAENDGGTTKALMRKMKGFDLIVTGDNHETFVYGQADVDAGLVKNEQLLVNPGSMMRMTAAQADHEPCVFLWWAGDNRVERVVLPHEKDVISRDHIERRQERDERIAAWVERIGEGDVDLELGFKENLDRHMKRHKVPDAVQDVVREVTE